MSNFTDFIAKTTSEKIILFELDYGEHQTSWYNYESGIWAWKYYTYLETDHNLGNGNLGFGALGQADTNTGSGDTAFHTLIGSVKADADTYTEASSVANCVSLDSSWYFDSDTQILYFHGEDYTEPQSHFIVVGITKGMSNRAININTMFYEPRITSDIEIEKTIDSLEWGIMEFDGASLTLSNHDGFFDDMFNNYIFGQPAVVKFGGNADRNDPMAYADYRTMFNGQVSEVELSENEVKIQLVEKRKGLSKMIPPNRFNATTYSNIADKNKGRSIPLIYGKCFQIPCLCINDGGSAPFVFKVADITNHTDGIKSIDGVQVAGVGLTPNDTSVLNATFSLTAAQYSIGQNVTADITGYVTSGATVIDSSLDVIKDILNLYGGIAYNDTNFNTSVLDSITTYDIGLFIDDDIEISEAIEKIAYSNMANFIVDDDGRYSWHKYDSTEAAGFTIAKEEILEGEYIAPIYDSKDYLTSCHVGFAADQDDDKYRWESNTSYETASYAKYGKYRELKMETLLVNSADAIELASAVMSYMNEVKPELNNTTGIQYVDKDIGDMCNLDGDRVDSTWMGSVKCEIIGIYKTLGNNPKVTIVGRKAP